MTKNDVAVTLRNGSHVSIHCEESPDGAVRLTAIDGSGPEIGEATHGGEAIMRLAVAEGWRNIGLGTQLFARLAESARRHGEPRLRALVPVGRGPLVTWLERRGGQLVSGGPDGFAVDVDVMGLRIPRFLIGTQALHWLIERSPEVQPLTVANVHEWNPIRSLLARAGLDGRAELRTLKVPGGDLSIAVRGRGLPVHWLAVDREEDAARRIADSPQPESGWGTFVPPEVQPMWTEALSEVLDRSSQFPELVADIERVDEPERLDLSQRGLILDRPSGDQGLWPGEVHRCCLVPGEGGAAPLLIVWLEIGATRIVLAVEHVEGLGVTERRKAVQTAGRRVRTLGESLQRMTGQLFL